MKRILLRLVSTFAIISIGCGGAISTATASASSLLTTVDSKPCAETAAQTWRFGYRLYFGDTTGHTTDRGAIPGVEQEAQGFADAVARDSGCALRATVDIFDMGSEPWTGTAAPLGFTPPLDNAAFRAAGNYDATLIRYPEQGNEEYSGITGTERVGDDSGTSAIYPLSSFPVDAAGRAYPEDPPHDPWHLLLMHEWMHQIVSFYVPAELGWPHNDVHGALEHGYVTGGQSAGVIESYFADMLQGLVLENGQPKGLMPQDFLLDGTPAHPRRRFLSVRSLSGARNRIRYVAPEDFDGTVTFTVQAGWESPNVNPVIEQGQAIGSSATWTVDDRRLPPEVTVCISNGQAGSASYRPYNMCFRPFVPRCVVPHLVRLGIAQARKKLSRTSCQLAKITRLHGRGKLRIRRQTPRPGRRLRPRSAVRLVVGPTTAVASKGKRH